MFIKPNLMKILICIYLKQIETRYLPTCVFIFFGVFTFSLNVKPDSSCYRDREYHMQHFFFLTIKACFCRPNKNIQKRSTLFNDIMRK